MGGAPLVRRRSGGPAGLCGRGGGTAQAQWEGRGVAMAHGHGQCCCCCGEAAAGLGGDRERGAAWGLYLRIDRQRLQCLNERREGSGALVFRAWEERGDRTQVGSSQGPQRCRCPGRAGRQEVGAGGSAGWWGPAGITGPCVPRAPRAVPVRPRPALSSSSFSPQFVESDDDEELLFNIP